MVAGCGSAGYGSTRSDGRVDAGGGGRRRDGNRRVAGSGDAGDCRTLRNGRGYRDACPCPARRDCRANRCGYLAGCRAVAVRSGAGQAGGKIFYLAADGVTINTIRPDGSDVQLLLAVDKGPDEIVVNLSGEPSGTFLIYGVAAAKEARWPRYFLV